jgi:hypothetical protein
VFLFGFSPGDKSLGSKRPAEDLPAEAAFHEGSPSDAVGALARKRANVVEAEEEVDPESLVESALHPLLSLRRSPMVPPVGGGGDHSVEVGEYYDAESLVGGQEEELSIERLPPVVERPKKGEKARGNYACAKCGLPKRGHVCAFSPHRSPALDTQENRRCAGGGGGSGGGGGKGHLHLGAPRHDDSEPRALAAAFTAADAATAHKASMGGMTPPKSSRCFGAGPSTPYVRRPITDNHNSPLGHAAGPRASGMDGRPSPVAMASTGSQCEVGGRAWAARELYLDAQGFAESYAWGLAFDPGFDWQAAKTVTVSRPPPRSFAASSERVAVASCGSGPDAAGAAAAAMGGSSGLAAGGWGGLAFPGPASSSSWWSPSPSTAQPGGLLHPTDVGSGLAATSATDGATSAVSAQDLAAHLLQLGIPGLGGVHPGQAAAHQALRAHAAAQSGGWGGWAPRGMGVVGAGLGLGGGLVGCVPGPQGGQGGMMHGHQALPPPDPFLASHDQVPGGAPPQPLSSTMHAFVSRPPGDSGGDTGGDAPFV